MAIPRNTDNLNIIQGLSDRPNDTDGLSAAGLKAKFDQAAGMLKDYINNTLIPFLESGNAASQMGVDTITGLTATNVQDALEEIVQAMVNISQGSVAPGSITATELDDDAVEEDKIKDGAVTTDKLAAQAVTTGKIDDLAVTTAKIALLNITTGLLADLAVTTDKLANLAVTTGKIANLAVDNTKLAANAVTEAKIAANAVTEGKIKNGAVTADKLATGAVTFGKLAAFQSFSVSAGTGVTFTVNQNSGGIVLLSGVNSGYGVVSIGRGTSNARGKLISGAGLDVDDHTTVGAIGTNEVLVSNTVSTPSYALLIVLNGTITHD